MRESVERETEGKGGNARVLSESKKGFVHHLDLVATSFYISNFPNDATSNDLGKLFVKYGKVGEVYIPKKLDKRGRRFGFVKFLEVSDEEKLSDSMADVWLGSFKLWVNRSRFSRTAPKEVVPPGITSQRSLVEEPFVGRSFRTALVSGGSSLVSQAMKVPVNESFCKELKGSVVGTLANEKDVRRIQTTLFMEGFRGIVVTPMGGNMVLLRSPVEDDVGRFLRSKNECIPYYFSSLKPWNPGMIAVQREVWVQVYGIPLHIWGDELFKTVGNKLGVFMDYDEQTASMARFDVARLKILTSTWAFIDVVLKVEVEGVCFNLWVMEERGSQRSKVVLGGEQEEEASLVVPSEHSDAVGAVSRADEVLSGEDEDSGEEGDVNVREKDQHGGTIEDSSNRACNNQLLKEGVLPLTSNKSTNNSISQEVIPSVPTDSVCIEETAMGHVAKEGVLAVLGDEVEMNVGEVCGAREVEVSVFEKENVGGPILDLCTPGMAKGDAEVDNGGPHVVKEYPCEELGRSVFVCNQTHDSSSGLGLEESDPLFVGRLVEEGEIRYSSLSEPEDVLSSQGVTVQRNNPKSRKHKPCSKFNPLGAPKCIQLTEILKEAGPKNRRRRNKGGCDVLGGAVEVGVAGNGGEDSSGRGSKIVESMERLYNSTGTPTPGSGLNMMFGKENSNGSNSLLTAQEENKEKLVQAAKLLSIQKEVGFTFNEQTIDIVKKLVIQETSDRAKKLDWENRQGDQ
ncbi:heterogeneous nuclear ribonucleoprotein [Trifolium repens]|nr:heterogeneous nuclear ribonucleoprotein [Trifolium repens]